MDQISYEGSIFAYFIYQNWENYMQMTIYSGYQVAEWLQWGTKEIIREEIASHPILLVDWQIDDED